jgi:hypothetical protein
MLHGSPPPPIGVPTNFFIGGGGPLWTVGSENGELGAVAPYSGIPLNLQISEKPYSD